MLSSELISKKKRGYLYDVKFKVNNWTVNYNNRGQPVVNELGPHFKIYECAGISDTDAFWLYVSPGLRVEFRPQYIALMRRDDTSDFVTIAMLPRDRRAMSRVLRSNTRKLVFIAQCVPIDMMVTESSYGYSQLEYRGYNRTKLAVPTIPVSQLVDLCHFLRLTPVIKSVDNMRYMIYREHGLRSLDNLYDNARARGLTADPRDGIIPGSQLLWWVAYTPEQFGGRFGPAAEFVFGHVITPYYRWDRIHWSYLRRLNITEDILEHIASFLVYDIYLPSYNPALTSHNSNDTLSQHTYHEWFLTTQIPLSD